MLRLQYTDRNDGCGLDVPSVPAMPPSQAGFSYPSNSTAMPPIPAHVDPCQQVGLCCSLMHPKICCHSKPAAAEAFQQDCTLKSHAWLSDIALNWCSNLSGSPCIACIAAGCQKLCGLRVWIACLAGDDQLWKCTGVRASLRRLGGHPCVAAHRLGPGPGPPLPALLGSCMSLSWRCSRPPCGASRSLRGPC